MTRADDVFISGTAHRVAAAVTDDGAHTEALVEVPHLDASVCAAADCPQGVARAAIHTAHLQGRKRKLAAVARRDAVTQ